MTLPLSRTAINRVGLHVWALASRIELTRFDSLIAHIEHPYGIEFERTPLLRNGPILTILAYKATSRLQQVRVVIACGERIEWLGRQLVAAVNPRIHVRAMQIDDEIDNERTLVLLLDAILHLVREAF